MYSALILMRSLGKWRYFITGSTIALLFGLVIRAISKLTAPLGERRVFRGTVTEILPAEDKTALKVSFLDAHGISHTAAFFSDAPAEIGTELRFAMNAELFASGNFPQKTADITASDGIYSLSVHRKLLRRQMMRAFFSGMLSCGLAAVLFVAAMKLCFP